MNRIDRLHAILTHLQSKKKVTAQEIADRFNISLRTVYRDVKALDESGVPVIGEAGSGYTVMEGYRLPPVMFSQEEAAAILVAGKLTEKMTDASLQKHFDAALFKIKAVLRTTDKEHVDNLTDHIAVLKRNLPDEEGSTQYLAALQKAVVDKKVIFIRYQGVYRDDITEREIEPIGLIHYSEGWHVIGWCRLRKDYRDFRISRVIRLHVKDESFGNTSHKSLQEYLDRTQTKQALHEVIVVFNKNACRYIGQQKHYYGYLKEEKDGDAIRMYFHTAWPEPMARWLLMFTNSVQVETPMMQLIMRELVEEIHAHYVPERSYTV